MSEISWSYCNNRILLEVAIFVPDSPSDITHITTPALIDTGATTSGITIPTAEQLGLRSMGKRPLVSAHGTDFVDRFLFRIGLYENPDRADDAALPFIFDEILGLGLTGNQNFGALIGMDILQQCDFSLTQTGRCSLKYG